MQLSLNQEQTQIAASVADVLSNEYTFTQRIQSLTSSGGLNAPLWQKFANLGWLGLSVSEECGGLGLGLLESGLLMEGLGRHLVIEPVWSSAILATHVLEACSPPRLDILHELISGLKRAALVHCGITSINGYSSAIEAEQTSSGYQLSGGLSIVPGAASADMLIVMANLKSGTTAHSVLFLINQNQPGVKLEPFKMLDGSQAGAVTFNQVQVPRDCLLSDAMSLKTAINQSIARGMLLLCWEALGSMTAAFEQTCIYTGTRSQFGKSLNQFQVVQHKLAEMAVLCREARAVCELGTVKATEHPDQIIHIAMRVKAKIARCAQLVSKDCVQLHGAMGVTEELPIASHFRKLLWFQTIWGSSDELDQRSGALLIKSGDAFQSAILNDMTAICTA